MEQLINDLSLIIGGLITAELAFMTARQAYARWSWFFAPKIPAGANGRWKLDWLASFFFLLVSAQQWLWLGHDDLSHASTIAGASLAVVAMLMRKAIRNEDQHQEEQA